MTPTRFVVTPTLTQRFGTQRIARLGHFLTECDPLADAAVLALAGYPRAEQERLVDLMLAGTRAALPEPLRVLESALAAVPVWVDPARCSRGGAAILRTGLLSGLVLGFKSLVLGYCSPAGNKPLIFSGRLENDVPRRLAETGRFFEAVSLPGGMERGNAGFTTTVRVRLMHARVRQGLLRSPRWQPTQWGVPINQYDMAGTILMFSSVLVDGLTELGVRTPPELEADVLHLWRYVGHVMGVDAELQFSTRTEADALWTLLEETQALPDEDSRRLTEALIGGGRERGIPEAWVRFAYALSRRLIGARYADALALPDTAWAVAPRLVSRFVRQMERTMKFVPGGEGAALRAGMSYWRRTVEAGAGDFTFPLPSMEQLSRA